ncbi:MAG: DJ-1 family protein [Candidatus Methanofastidiosa archaeon]|jgi:protease I|nr:DJ-1 family protein [Candidatus Methanofastidiosa archaeon]HOM95445.1 DJ-1/PfpI family protein [Methanofastidiosum sp.]HPC81326.1 DJ-1/PfpI family protein [Methanofastidiosum sp.]HRS25317.1 DJ-1/PfpI family protein [Methanofastidiosum sp.]
MVCILMWVAQERFRDEELFIPKSLFEENEYTVTVVSHNGGTALSKFGKIIEVKGIDDIKMDDYDAFLLVGGPGTFSLTDDKILHSHIKDAIKKIPLLGGICYAPNIMARAGALKNKKATVWGDQEIFDKEGVIFDSKDIVVDGNIITANGPDAAQLWAKAIINYIKNELKK